MDLTITHEQLEEWAGFPLSDEQVKVLEEVIPHTSIPEAIGVIAAYSLANDDTEE